MTDANCNNILVNTRTARDENQMQLDELLVQLLERNKDHTSLLEHLTDL